MRFTKVSAIAAAALFSVSLTACGNDEGAGGGGTTTETAAPMATSAAPSMSTSMMNFGAGCAAVPADSSDPGSFAGMAQDPVATAASNNPLLSTLVTAVGKVPGLAETLNSQEAITVYAPSNDAFAAVQQAVGDEAFNALLADPAKLGALLQYHVVPQRYDAAQLVEAGRSTALAGGDVTVGGSATAPTLTSGDGTEASVLCGNVPTANATVFVIDKVLMPAAG